MSKSLNGIIFFDDGMGFHAENGTVSCLNLVLNGSVFDPSFNHIENQIITLQNQVNG